MSKVTRATAYMKSVLPEHVDPATGLVNDTTLSEDCADHFGWYDSELKELDIYTPPDWLCCLAADIAWCHDKDTT